MAFKISKRISIDLNKTDVNPVLRMKQGDRLTQEIMIDLLFDNAPWTIPDDVTVLQLSYCKSDLVGGCYDKMPDNENAGAFNNNRTSVIMQLHPQVLNVAGSVVCELRMLSNNGDILNSFNFFLNVEKSPIAMTTISEGYYNNVFDGATFTPKIDENGILSWTNDKGLPNPPEVNLGIASRSAVLYAEQELTDQQKSQARKNIGAASVKDLEAKQSFLPVAKGYSENGVAYTATDSGSGAVLPEVAAADSSEQIGAVGKGRQIVFIPYETNMTNAPTLQINGGQVIPIRMRATKNQGSYELSPDATLPVPVGALMRGVPYTMTFCGKYWLVDSQITQFDQYNAAMLDAYASALIGLTNGDTVAVPIINSTDGVSGDMATMFVTRSAEENKNPSVNGNVTVPTAAKVSEMIAAAIGDTAGALAAMDHVIGGAEA